MFAQSHVYHHKPENLSAGPDLPDVVQRNGSSSLCCNKRRASAQNPVQRLHSEWNEGFLWQEDKSAATSDSRRISSVTELRGLNPLSSTGPTAGKRTNV